MANIPQFVSKERVSSEAPAVMQRTEKVGVMADPSSVESNVGRQAAEQLFDLGQKMIKVENANDNSKAQIQYTQGMLAFEEEVKKDPAKFKEYDNYMQKLEDAAAKNFRNADARETFKQDSGLKNVIFKNKLQADVFKQQVKLDQVNTVANAKVKAEAAYSVPKEQLPLALAGIKQDFTEAEKRGTFDQADSLVQYNKIVEDIRTGRPQKAIYDDQSTQEDESEVLKQLKAGAQGQFPDLTFDERTKLIKESQQRIFNNNQAYKRRNETSQQERNTGVIDKLANLNLTLNDVDAEFAIPEDKGGIPRNTLLTYKKGLLTGIKNNLTYMLNEKSGTGYAARATARANTVKQYNELIELYIDDKSDMWKAKEALANAWKDGALDPIEAKLLDPLKSQLNDISFNRSKNPLVWAIKEIKSHVLNQSNSTDEDLARNIKQLLGGVAGGQEPREVTKQMLSEVVKSKLPDYQSYPKEGVIKYDKGGNAIRVFPDGTFKEEVTKKPTETK